MSPGCAVVELVRVDNSCRDQASELIAVRIRRRRGSVAPPRPLKVRATRIYQWHQLGPSDTEYEVGGLHPDQAAT